MSGGFLGRAFRLGRLLITNGLGGDGVAPVPPPPAPVLAAPTVVPGAPGALARVEAPRIRMTAHAVARVEVQKATPIIRVARAPQIVSGRIKKP